MNFLRLSTFAINQEEKYLMRTHLKNNLVIMFTPILSTDPSGENYHEFCWLNLIKYKPYVDCVENAYNQLTDKREIIKLWEDFSKNLLECGKQLPGNLRREFEQVSKYNEKRKKKKEQEKIIT